MAIDRSTILRGPAIITHDSASYYTKDDIKVDINLETQPVEVSAYGKVDEIVTNRIGKVTASPVGAFSNRAKLWPYGGTAIGSSIFGATDKPLVVWTKADGIKYNFVAAALTKMPSIKLSSVSTICGPAEWTLLGANATAMSGSSSFESESTASFNDTAFDTSDIVKSTYSGAWGSVSGFTAIITKDGFDIDFNLGLTAVSTDTDGIVDYILSSLEVTASFKPLGPTVANLIAAMKAQGTGAARGMSLAGMNNSSSLVISGDAAGKPKVTITGAQLKQAPLLFGREAERIDTLQFVATRTFTGGARNALFTVDVV
jgi:hypothetical protein